MSLIDKARSVVVGFEKIENLEAFTKVKSIWLECNCIKKIEGLDHMTGLRCL